MPQMIAEDWGSWRFLGKGDDGGMQQPQNICVLLRNLRQVSGIIDPRPFTRYAYRIGWISRSWFPGASIRPFFPAAA